MAGDPSQMDPEEAAWVADRNAAKARQMAAKQAIPQPTEAEWDAQRRAQSEKQMAATKAMAVTPGSLTGQSTDPWNIDTRASLPSGEIPDFSAPAAHPTPQPVKASNTDHPSAGLHIWECMIEGVKFYAHSWEAMKVRVKDYNGSHKVYERKFGNSVSEILGFFAPDQYDAPKGETKSFDIIVQGGKVFKDES